MSVSHLFDKSDRLALEGGQAAVSHPTPIRKRHGVLDKAHLSEVIDSEMLFYYFGTKVKEFEKQFAAYYGRTYCIACSSGSAAVHIAIGTLQLPPGSEVITSPITDMGGVTGILYQGLIPVFADVDPNTLNLDPASVATLITPRTGAILAVHHAGLAADLDPIFEIAGRHSLPVIEDCAQAYGCEYRNQPVGKFGKLSTFSLNHFKHISTGSGGMVLVDDDQLRYLATLFVDKCYQRDEGIRNPFFLAPNYQMTELQGAVALAQLSRLSEFIDRRVHLGLRLSERLRDVEGITLQTVKPGNRHSYFLFLIKLDLDYFSCDAARFSDALQAEGVKANAHLITGGRPIYLYDVFQRRSAFPGSHYPFQSVDLRTDRQYPPGLCPVAEEAFASWLTIELLEHYSEQNVDEIALAIEKVAHHYRHCLAMAT